MATRPLAAQDAEPTMQLRIAWGGGAEQLWRGVVRLSEGTLANPRPLGIEADEPGQMYLEAGRLQIASRSARAYDGVDLDVSAPLSAHLLISIYPANSPAPEKPLEIPLADLVSNYHNTELDTQGNRLLVRRAPGDVLRVRFEDGRDSLVFSPGETLKLDLLPRLLGAGGAKVRFDIQLVSAKTGETSWSEERELAVDDAAPPSVPLQIKLPAAEGVYDLTFTARTRNRLRLWQELAQRKVQLVVVEPTSLPAPFAGERSLVKLAEIDPAEPLNPAWWNRFAQLAVLPGFRNKGPLGTGEAVPWQHPRLGETFIQLGPGGKEPNISWEAYPLPIDRPGEPHVLEIDYPSDVPQFLSISIVEPNSAGAVLPLGLDSGVYVPDDAAQDSPRVEKHRLVFWPRTRSPLVLLANRKDGSRAVFGKMRLYGGQGRLPRAFAREQSSGRLWAGYLDRPLFPENFSAPDALDNWSGRSLDDWATFYQGALRTVDYLNHVGHNGLMLSVVADGSAIYPSRLLQATPRYDTGVFFGTGQDPLRKDVLELLLRIFDREQLKLVPLVQFAAPLPELEEILRRGGIEAVGLEWVGADGATWRQHNAPQRGLAPYYNPLNPRVQEAIVRVVRELVTRYGRHPALAGIALDLTSDGYAALPGVEWGFDDATIAAFEQAHPQLQVPGTGPTRFGERARYLTTEQRSAWVAWRARQLENLYRRIQAEIEAACPGGLLYLATADVFSSPQTQRALRPQLPRKTRADQLLLELGIRSPTEVPDARWILLRPQRLAPMASLGAQGANLEVGQSVELDRLAQAQPLAGAVFYHPPQEARLASFDEKSPFKRTYTWLVSQPALSGQENRRRFIRALASYDVQQIFDGGALMPLGQESAYKAVLAAYRRLPAEKFETLPDTPQPVTVRVLHKDDQTWFYVVNDSPWSVSVRIPLALPLTGSLEPLDSRRPTPQLERDARGAVIVVHLEPYDLAGGRLTASRVALLQPKVDLPPAAMEQLMARMKELGDRQVALSYPQPLQSWPINRGFEEPWLEGQLPGWTCSAQAAQVEMREKHAGQQSVRLVRNPGDKEAWLLSDPIQPPKTGRLAISVWLRAAGSVSPPVLRLAAQWQSGGRTEYRYTTLGPLSGDAQEPIPNTWQQYILSITDLPVDEVAQLQVRFDLMTTGEVWIDDVQLYDLIFDKDTERVELIKMIWHHTTRLQEGRVGDCLRFLESYWPRYLTAHVPLVNGPAAPPERTAAQPKRAPPPPTEDEKPGFLDRIRNLLPGRSWF